MAKLPLRSYIREIENLIDRGQTEEAIAHCRYILQSYPKYIDAYRLLGKSYLESRRYGEAADIFTRVLSSVPDDFVSSIGLSIIREDEGNLDAAIWHMERAFETQPANSAVQDEMRRLYGRRDGLEPQKIRLTRGALVRSYAKGDLYQQAIAEIRVALSEDPDRSDLQVLLARMYHLSNQKVKATEVCSVILTKHPFCYEANKILADILPGTARADDAVVYQQRVVALDPYAAYLSPTVLATSDVPESAINIDHLAWQPEMAAAKAQPHWAESLGISIESDKEQAGANWLSGPAPTGSLISREEPGKLPFEEAAPTPPEPPKAEQIPDWMKDAGWGPSSGEAVESSPFLFNEGEDDSGEAAPGEIPEWLRGMQPTDEEEPEPASAGADDNFAKLFGASNEPSGEAAPAASAPPPPEPDSQPPDWLAGLGGVTMGGAPQPAAMAPSGGEVPDWLAGMGGEETAAPVQAAAPAAGAAEVPDWLSAMGGEETAAPAQAAAAPTPASEVPDWLSAMGGEEAAAPAQAAAAPTPASEVPDWLSAMGGEETAAPPQAAVPTPASEMPDWFSSMGGEPIAGPTQAAAPVSASETPDWLSGLGGESTSEPAQAAEPTPASEMPDWFSSVGGEPIAGPTQAAGSTPASETPDWFSSLGGESIAEPSQAAAPAPTSETPDWLSGLGGESTGEPAQAAEPISGGETPDWMSGLSGLGGESTIEPIQAAEPTPANEMPAWLSGMEVGAVSESQQELEPPAAGEQKEPGWLSGYDLATPQEGKTTTPSEAERPDWLAGLGSDAASEPAASAEALPAWPGSKSQAENFVPESQQPPAEEIPPQPAEEKPAWIQDLTAAPTGTEPQTPPSDQGEGVLPDWLKGLGSESQALTEKAAPRPPDTVTGWLQSKDIEAATARQRKTESEPPAEPASETPAWLRGLQPETPVKPENVFPQTTEGIPSSKTASEPLEEGAIQPGEVPTWLQSKPEGTIPQGQNLEIPGDVNMLEPDTELPEWLKESQGEETASEQAPSPPEEQTPQPASEAPTPADQVPTASEQDAALAWLESLAQKQGADSELLFSKPEERTEVPPEWVKAAAATDQTAQPQEEAAAPQPEAELPGWLEQGAVEESAAAVVSQPESEAAGQPAEELPEWLQAAQAAEPPVNEEAPPAVTVLPTEYLESQPIEEVEQPAAPEAAVEPAIEGVPGAEAPAEGAPSSAEQEAALTWLESLAQKQGADSELLFSKPEDRNEIPPSWVQAAAMAEQAEAGEPTAETPIEQVGAPVEETSAMFEEAQPTEGAQPLESEAAQPSQNILEWMQSTESEPAPAAETAPEIGGEGLPGWLVGSSTQEAPTAETASEWVQAAEVTSVEVEPQPETLAGEALTTETPVQPVEELAAPAAEETPAVEALPEAQQAIPVESVEPSVQPSVEAPVSEVISEPVEEAAPAVEEAAPAEAMQPVSEAAPETREELPEWLASVEQPSQALTPEPSPVEQKPVEPSEEGITGFLRRKDRSLETRRFDMEEPVTTPIPSRQQPIFQPPAQPAPAAEGVQALLSQGRSAMDEGKVEDALSAYTSLVSSESSLDLVINDLQEALYRYPMNIQIWQCLGDAHLRNNQLQEALNAYTKAEELLR